MDGSNVDNENTAPSKESILQEIDSLISVPDVEKQKEDIQAFVKRRLQFLYESATKKQISMATSAVTDFIHPEAEVKPNFMFDGFRMDDESIYADFISNVAEYKRTPGNEAHTTRSLMPFALLKTVSNYFGNNLGTENTEADHHAFYLDNTEIDSDAISMKELKGKHIALCTEKAATAHNILKFLGYDAHLILSKCELIPGKKELHAYNIVTTEKGSFIFDPTNPSLTSDKEGNLLKLQPSIYILEPDQIEQLQKGGNITVQHTDYVLENDMSTTKEVENRIYAGPTSNFLK